MLQDLKRDILNGTKPLSDAIPAALPQFRDKISEHKIAYLVNEYQGYQNNALEYYKHPTKEYPSYRVVNGTIKLMLVNDGSLTDFRHPLASKDQLFIAAPIGWIEESAGLGIDPTMIEMAEMGKMPGGIVVCVAQRVQVQRIVDIVKQSLLSFIDEANM